MMYIATDTQLCFYPANSYFVLNILCPTEANLVDVFTKSATTFIKRGYFKKKLKDAMCMFR